MASGKGVLTPLLLIIGLLSACSSAGQIDGATIYANRCSTCHGERGLGDGPTAKALGLNAANLQRAVKEKSRADLLRVIELGRNAMPAFRLSLSEAERKAVLEYTMGLASRQTGGSVARGLDPSGNQGLR